MKIGEKYVYIKHLNVKIRTHKIRKRQDTSKIRKHKIRKRKNTIKIRTHKIRKRQNT